VVWIVTTVGSPKLFEVDATTDRVIGTTHLPPSVVPSAVAAGAGGVWVTDLLGDTVLRLERRRPNPALPQRTTLEVTRRIRVGRAPKDIAVGQGSVWVANYLDGTISRINPRTNHVDTLAVGPYPEHLAVGQGSVWVALDPP
jgi:DNA-binding beta-propeller fold protein YncE